MIARLIIDKSGRVVIPKSLREELRLGPGDALELESAGGQITLRPVREMAPLVKEQGVWVYYTGQPLSAASADELVEQSRAGRDFGNPSEGE